MSAMDRYGEKVELPRGEPDEFWDKVRRHYIGASPRKWKYLAMLVLREAAGWPLSCIGEAFGHPKGHVSRCLTHIRHELEARFALPEDFGRRNKWTIDEDGRPDAPDWPVRASDPGPPRTIEPPPGGQQ